MIVKVKDGRLLGEREEDRCWRMSDGFIFLSSLSGPIISSLLLSNLSLLTLSSFLLYFIH